MNENEVFYETHLLWQCVVKENVMVLESYFVWLTHGVIEYIKINYCSFWLLGVIELVISLSSRNLDLDIFFFTPELM